MSYEIQKKQGLEAPSSAGLFKIENWETELVHLLLEIDIDLIYGYRAAVE